VALLCHNLITLYKIVFFRESASSPLEKHEAGK
jgi:hypothetical protein